MLKQDRYFHYQATKGARSLGFSALFVRHDGGKVHMQKGYSCNNNGEQMIWMSVTRANVADKHFNKKIARDVLKNRALELVRAKDVPAILCNLANKAEGAKAYDVRNGDFCSVLRYFL